MQATPQLATTLYPQTPFSQVKNPVLRIRELVEHTEQKRKDKQLEQSKSKKPHETGDGDPLPPQPWSDATRRQFF